MKATKVTVDNVKQGDVELPLQFSEEVRPDLIKRGVLAIQSRRRQAYGAKSDAGKRASAELSRRRRKYRGSYGHGISRVPRKILSRRGTRFYWVGAFAPGTVGGRRAHPPKAEKLWELKINKKENRKAIRSAIAATGMKSVVEERGHKVPESYPLVIENKIEGLEKTKDVRKALMALGLKDELTRGAKKKVRAGKGKGRGRPYKKKASVLIVTGGDCSLLRAAYGIEGIDVVQVHELNAELLAPGTVPGRLTVWSEGAIEKLEKERLFT